MCLVNWNCNCLFLLHAVSLSNSKCHSAQELKHSKIMSAGQKSVCLFSPVTWTFAKEGLD